MHAPSNTNLPSNPLKAAFVLAVAMPSLLAFNLPPSPTLLNQCLGIALWGGVVWSLGAMRRPMAALRDAWAMVAAAAVLMFCVLMSFAVNALPAPIALSAFLVLSAAAMLAWAGCTVGHRVDSTAAFSWFLYGLVAAGLLSAIVASIQVFAPNLQDGQWIARSGMPGRAVGNLRQPNHLSSLLLLAVIAAAGLTELRLLRLRHSASLTIFLTLANVLSASRTGVVGVVLLAGWGVLDRRLSRGARLLLIGTPAVYALAWAALTLWAHTGGPAFGGELRLGGGAVSDISSSRFAIWRDTIELIRQQPGLGVGFGEFNLAWTLTRLPDRPLAFFDHTHNLPLQLAVELGLPLAALVLGLLVVALVQGWRRAWRCDDGVARRVAFMILIMIGLHSQLEYPLWYAYFLLPTAFAGGFVLARPVPARTQSGQTPPPRAWPPVALGLTMMLGSIAAVLNYHQIVVIYEPPSHAAPLEERIARGQRSPLFSHHADYAAATAFGEPKAPLSPSQQLAFQRAPHQLLDMRLMIAWAQALAVQGEIDKARWLAARIREFRNPGSDEFFQPCAMPAEAAQAFQCQAPQRAYHWREFVAR